MVAGISLRAISAFAFVALPCALSAGATIQVQPFFLSSPSDATLLANHGQALSDAKLIALIDNPALETTIVTALPKYFETSTHVVILFPGVGGNVARWGATSESTLTLGNAMVKKGIYPIFVEHPVYYRARQGGFDNERRELAEKYTPLPFQLENFTSSLDAVVGKIPRDANGSLTKKVWLMGRSNGTNRILEWLDSLGTRDKKSLELAQSLSGVLLSGIVSPDLNRSFFWQGAEHLEAQRDPDESDLIAMALDHATANQMRWASRQPSKRAHPTPLPPLVAIASKQDAYFPLELQVEAIQAFFDNHPNASVDLLLAPCRHDPSASFSLGDGKTVKQGKLIKEVLQSYVLSGTRPPGLRITELPHFSSVRPCAELLAQYDQATLAPLREYP